MFCFYCVFIHTSACCSTGTVLPVFTIVRLRTKTKRYLMLDGKQGFRSVLRKVGAYLRPNTDPQPLFFGYLLSLDKQIILDAKNHPADSYVNYGACLLLWSSRTRSLGGTDFIPLSWRRRLVCTGCTVNLEYSSTV